MYISDTFVITGFVALIVLPRINLSLDLRRSKALRERLARIELASDEHGRNIQHADRIATVFNESLNGVFEDVRQLQLKTGIIVPDPAELAAEIDINADDYAPVGVTVQAIGPDTKEQP